MYLPQSNIFKDLRQEAVNEFSEIAVEQAFDEGAVLFSKGDPANTFYILIDGKVGLTIGNTPKKDYVVESIGESFGWSSLVGGDSYTAEATCLAPSRLLMFNKDAVEKVFDAHARSGRVFYKRLAGELGKRLIAMHG